MASTKGNNDGTDRQSTPSTANPRRCSLCGELVKGHNQLPKGFCERVQELKATLKTENVTNRSPQVAVKSEEQGMSISQANQGSTTRTTTRLPTIVELDATGLSSSALESDAAIIVLPVSSRPNLKSQFAPIFEMKTLLHLRSLALTNFHTTEREDWAFVVSGSPARMKAWVAENMHLTTTRMNFQGGGYSQSVISLVLGILVGVALVVWGLPLETI